MTEITSTDGRDVESGEQALLEVDSLSVEYRTPEGPLRALRDVSMSVERGQTVGIAGESGSGKSTLALAIMRYLGDNGAITEGEVNFDGKPMLEFSPGELKEVRGNRIAHVPQDPKTSLNPSLTVGEQIKETIELHTDGISSEEARERTLELLAEVDIPDPAYNADKHPHELSGGQQQRVLFAMALSCSPDLLILDEPTTGLDVTTQAKILDLIHELEESFDTATLLITHDLGVLAQTVDDIVILYAGEIMEKGDVRQVLKEPANPYTQGLLAARPQFDEDRELTAVPGDIPSLIDVPDGCIFADRCEFADKGCRSGHIEMEDVPGSAGHQTRCRRWEAAVEDPIEPDSTPSTGDGEERTAGDVLLEAEDVRKYFGEESFFDRWLEAESKVKAVDGVDLEVREGETLGLVGESGCGKSTLGQTLLRLLSIDDGTITYDGQDIASLEGADLLEFRSDNQIVFQNPHSSLNPRKTIETSLERPLKLFTDLDADERESRVHKMLEQVDLGPSYAARYPHELSGGEKQRVAIARAFAANPAFIVLDEPVSALDVSVQANVLNLLSSLRQDYGSSYLFISHDLSVVNHISDRIAVMYLGHVMEVGSDEAVFEPPYHPYTRALLSSVPLTDPDRQLERDLLEGDVPSARDPPSGCPFHTRCPQYIGDICENEYPELESKGESGDDDHCIACHHDVEDLSAPIEEVDVSGIAQDDD